MLCGCHGEPAYWHSYTGRATGGYWRCAVRAREASRRTYSRRREAKLQQQRDRYDTDPIHRIEKNLHDHARRRRETIERRRQAMQPTEGV